MNPDEGFSQAQTALNEAAKQTKWINDQVGAGQLRMNPEAAEAAAKHCEDCAIEVDEMIMNASQIERVQGLGDYDSSSALKHHFEQKANQSGAGAIPLLGQLRQEMLNQSEAFRNAAKDYRSTDEQIADDLGRGSQQ